MLLFVGLLVLVWKSRGCAADGISPEGEKKDERVDVNDG